MQRYIYTSVWFLILMSVQNSHTLLEMFWRVSLYVTEGAIAKLCVT